MKKKVLFVYNHEYPNLWRDGLYAALQELEKEDYDISWHNLASDSFSVPPFDFVLGWGAFGGPVDKYLQNYPDGIKKGLCVAGNAYPPYGWSNYDVLFYETDWAKHWLLEQGVDLDKLVHAFGINSTIYNQNFDPLPDPIWDYITVGSFSDWKRQRLMLNKTGTRLAIGEIQQGNPQESLDIIGDLLLNGVGVSNMIPPERLALLYQTAARLYIPADTFGGGERAVLEGRACGCAVEVEADNPKLQELLTCPIWDHIYYANQLREGIKRCL